MGSTSGEGCSAPAVALALPQRHALLSSFLEPSFAAELISSVQEQLTGGVSEPSSWGLTLLPTDHVGHLARGTDDGAAEGADDVALAAAGDAFLRAAEETQPRQDWRDLSPSIERHPRARAPSTADLQEGQPIPAAAHTGQGATPEHMPTQQHQQHQQSPRRALRAPQHAPAPASPSYWPAGEEDDPDAETYFMSDVLRLHAGSRPLASAAPDHPARARARAGDSPIEHVLPLGIGSSGGGFLDPHLRQLLDSAASIYKQGGGDAQRQPRRELAGGQAEAEAVVGLAAMGADRPGPLLRQFGLPVAPSGSTPNGLGAVGPGGSQGAGPAEAMDHARTAAGIGSQAFAAEQVSGLGAIGARAGTVDARPGAHARTFGPDTSRLTRTPRFGNPREWQQQAVAAWLEGMAGPAAGPREGQLSGGVETIFEVDESAELAALGLPSGRGAAGRVVQCRQDDFEEQGGSPQGGAGGDNAAQLEAATPAAADDNAAATAGSAPSARHAPVTEPAAGALLVSEQLPPAADGKEAPLETAIAAGAAAISAPVTQAGATTELAPVPAAVQEDEDPSTSAPAPLDLMVSAEISPFTLALAPVPPPGPVSYPGLEPPLLCSPQLQARIGTRGQDQPQRGTADEQQRRGPAGRQNGRRSVASTLGALADGGRPVRRLSTRSRLQALLHSIEGSDSGRAVSSGRAGSGSGSDSPGSALGTSPADHTGVVGLSAVRLAGGSSSRVVHPSSGSPRAARAGSGSAAAEPEDVAGEEGSEEQREATGALHGSAEEDEAAEEDEGERTDLELSRWHQVRLRVLLPRPTRARTAPNTTIYGAPTSADPPAPTSAAPGAPTARPRARGAVGQFRTASCPDASGAATSAAAGSAPGLLDDPRVGSWEVKPGGEPLLQVEAADVDDLVRTGQAVEVELSALRERLARLETLLAHEHKLLEAVFPRQAIEHMTRVIAAQSSQRARSRVAQTPPSAAARFFAHTRALERRRNNGAVPGPSASPGTSTSTGMSDAIGTGAARIAIRGGFDGPSTALGSDVRTGETPQYCSTDDPARRESFDAVPSAVRPAAPSTTVSTAASTSVPDGLRRLQKPLSLRNRPAAAVFGGLAGSVEFIDASGWASAALGSATGATAMAAAVAAAQGAVEAGATVGPAGRAEAPPSAPWQADAMNGFSLASCLTPATAPAPLASAHRHVTVLFADIVGFTSMCSCLQPIEVMTFLNGLFVGFDSLCDIYGVYKVETIGDCFMVVGGLITVDEEGFKAVRGDGSEDALHALKVMSFAKALVRDVAHVRMPHNGEPLRMRVGLHSGPVTAGIVGAKMPRFCLFGDTVNTASRMESTCEPGCIHASAATRELLRDEAWAATGGVQVKGKGLMETYIWRPPPGFTTAKGGFSASLAAVPSGDCRADGGGPGQSGLSVAPNWSPDGPGPSAAGRMAMSDGEGVRKQLLLMREAAQQQQQLRAAAAPGQAAGGAEAAHPAGGTAAARAGPGGPPGTL